MKVKFQKSKGFSLVEIILVMFIIAFSFIGIYKVLSKTSQHEKEGRYSLIASNLAQEGIEIVRNKRDENALNDKEINDGLNNETCYPYWGGEGAECDSDAKKAEVGLDGDVYRNCDSEDCDENWKETPFTRKCTISGDTPTKWFTAECEVKWKSPSLGIDKNITVKSLLTDWQEN